jgi:DNA-binding MarR family transcriptional regulator
MKREDLYEVIEHVEDPVLGRARLLGNLHYTHFHLFDRYRKIMQKYDLTPIQTNVLGIVVIKYPETLSLEEIKKMVLEPGSDVSRIITRLASKGFIEKVTDRRNRRKLAIRTTPRGNKMYGKIVADPTLKAITNGLRLSEMKAFVATLKKLRS